MLRESALLFRERIWRKCFYLRSVHGKCKWRPNGGKNKMPIGISDLIHIAQFVIGLFNSSSTAAQPQQCVEAPKIQASVEQRVYVNPYPADQDYCKAITAEQWDRVGQSMFDAFEGTKPKNDICRALVAAQKYARK